MAFVLLAIGLVLIVEGLVYALAPSLLDQLLETLRSLPENAVRQIGMICLLSGVILVWIAFEFGIG